MKVIIIEDEYPAMKKLQRLIAKTDPGIEVLAGLTSVEDAVNWLNVNSSPDLVFMDIQLEDGLCFDIFDRVEISCPVIFTTAFDKYAIKAFKVNSVDYLLKPIDENELKRALHKYKTVHENSFGQNIEKIIDTFKPKTKERFLIRIGEHYKSFQVNDICFFFNKERSSFMNTGKKNNYAVDYSLDRIEELIDHKIFFRVNRNFIINYDAIKDIIRYSSNRLKIILHNHVIDDEIIVSRDRVLKFKDWMNR